MNDDGILKLFGAFLIAVALLSLAVQSGGSPPFHLKIEIEYGTNKLD